ncbi:acyl-CoA thioesterase [Cerasicoccus maritimus]|uniref:acyl-CoA thioesterase n=1 Tax=Cerasicoccus maritimus TaxID=490089 RepID=UPI0028527AD0|nr:thioesterase family protein [Cerasicoccus maritimus]
MPIDDQGVFTHEFPVTADMIDRQKHVNNVVYVQWMQDVAIAHSEACGGYAAMEAEGGGWVARSHRIEYLKPALEGDMIRACTWVADATKVRSHRRYQFYRLADEALIARGETDWVYVDAQTGRPLPIPDSVRACYPLVER